MDTSVQASGAYVLKATSNQTINAVNVAGSVAVGLGFGLGLALAGSGVNITNTVAVDAQAYQNGSGSGAGSGIQAASVSVTASDTSSITATAAAVSLAASLGGVVGGAVSIGVSLAQNTVANDVEAFIASATVGDSTTPVGAITVGTTESATIHATSAAAALSAAGALGAGVAISGAGAAALNVILGKDNAYVSGSSLTSNGAVSITTVDMPSNPSVNEIDVTIVAASLAVGVGGLGGGALSIGASVAHNYIGFNANGSAASRQVEAYVQNSSISATGALTVSATAKETIHATITAVSVAVAGGLVGGVAASGAGTDAENSIGATIKAYIDGDGSTGIAANTVSLTATDNSTIVANAATAAVAAVYGTAAAGALSIGTAQATNTIGNDVEASISNAKHKVKSQAGDLKIDAEETATITTTVAAASAAASISLTSAAFSGAGAAATNTITNTVKAFIFNSSGVEGAGAVKVTANDTPTINATTVAATLSAGFVGVAAGALTADSTVDENVSAYTDTAQVTADHGNVEVTATSSPNITTTSVVAALSASIVGVTVAGADSDVTIEGTTQAYVNASNLSAAGNSVLVHATTTSTAAPTESASSFGTVAVAAITSEATIQGTTQAYASGGTSITATSLDIQAKDTSNSDSNTVVTGVGFATGAGASSTSLVSRTTQAFIAPNAVITANGATVTVGATSTATPNANITGVSLGAVAVTAETVTDTVSGKTYAYVGEGASVKSAGLDVGANSTNTAIAAPTTVAVGLAAGTGTHINSTVNPDVEAFIGPQAGGTATGNTTTINVGGGMATVHATSVNSATANLKNGTGGGITISALLLSAKLGGSTSAYAGGTVNVTAGSLGLAANSQNTSSSTLFTVSVAAISGSGNSLTPTESHNTLAYIAGGSKLAAGGANLSVNATSNSSATADVEGGAGSAVGVDVDLPTAAITGSTLAYVGEGATVTGGGLNLQSSASSQNALAKVNSINVGIAAGQGSQADSAVSGDIEAFIGPQAGTTPLGLTTTLNLTGALTVQASTAANPTTNVFSGGGGAIAVAALITDAKVNDQTLAYLSTGTLVTNASNLKVLATETDAATNTTEIASGGILNGQGTNATAEAEPTISGYIAAADCVTTTGAVLVQAINVRAEADATAKSYGGGGVQVGVPLATVTTSPSVVGYIGTGANISAGGNVTVDAEARSDPGQTFTNDITAVNPSTDTITFPQHGLLDGDVVVYTKDNAAAPINTPTGPLAYNREYPVVVTGADTLQLGSTFNADSSGVSASGRTITFATPDLFLTGDPVHLDPMGNTPVGGLSTSTTYYVRTLNANTIELYTSLSDATSSALSAQANTFSGTTVHANNSFSPNEAVTYVAQPTVPFSTGLVDVSYQTDGSGNIVPFSTNPTVVNFQDASSAWNIFLGQDTNGDGIPDTGHNFQTGDAVVYHADPATGTVISPLVNGQTYYVIRVDQWSIQLAATERETTQHQDSHGNWVAGANPIHLVDPKTSGYTPEPQSFTVNPLGQLQSGQTYYVLPSVTSSSFQLAATPGGTALSVNYFDGSGNAVSGGLQQFFKAGVALSPSSGTQDLHIAFAPSITPNAGVGDALFGENGVSLRQINPPPGNGVSSASAIGGNGGGLNFAFPTATGNATPTVKAYADACVVSGGNVSITSLASPNVTAYANNDGGGAISIAQSQASTSTNITNSAFVGADSLGNPGDEANISTTGNVPGGNNFVLSSQTSSTSSATADCAGGGVVASIGSTSKSDVTDTTTTTVGQNATISARTVNVSAEVTSINANATSSAIGGGLFGDSNAEANSKIDNSTVQAHLAGSAGSNTQITGTQGVDVVASQNQVHPTRSAKAIFIGIGPSIPTGKSSGTLTTTVQADQGVTVNAGPRLPGDPNLQPIPPQTSSPSNSQNDLGSLAVYSAALDNNISGSDGDPTTDHNIDWNSDVKVMSGPSPTLIINANGIITTAIDVGGGFIVGHSAVNASGDIVVPNIINQDPGDIWFVTGSTPLGSTYSGDITHSQTIPTFSFNETLSQVTIINNSPHRLIIQDISVASSTARPQVELDTGSVSLLFHIKQTVAPTLINIDQNNLFDTSAHDLVIDGLIDNPIGTTTIINTNGNILSTTPRGIVGPDGNTSLIVTNILDIEAPKGSIGTTSLRINIDLVQSQDTVLNLTRPTMLTALAGGNVDFDLAGILRDPDITNFIVNADSITAGQNIDILLQDGEQESHVAGNAGGINVAVRRVQDSRNPFFNFYQPDMGSPNGLDLGVFADLTQNTPIAVTYNFRSLDSQQNRTLPGLVAGGNIFVNAANPATTVPNQIIHVIGITELLGTGFIDAITSGNITLTEYTGFGPMRIGTVASTVGDVQLTVPDTSIPGDDLLIMPNGQITAPGGILSPSYSAPQVAATVNPTGGNTPAVNPSGQGPATVSGYLAPGNYYVVFTFTFPNGSQTLASPSSSTFKVTAGQIPQLTLPLLPVGATGYNIYLSNPSATPGSATFYAGGVTVSTFNLLNAAPQGGAVPPGANPVTGAPTVTPTVNPTGGGSSGGKLTPGTYFVFYTSVNAAGTQSPPSQSSTNFTVSAGNIPQVMLPPLPAGATSYDLYLSDRTAQSGTGVMWLSGITSTIVNINSDPPNGNVNLPVNNVAAPPPIVVVNNNPAFNNNNNDMDCNCGSMPMGGGGGTPALTGLASGTYYVVYTFTYISDAETFASQRSNTFTIGQGQLATVILPPLPPGASGINLYVSANGAAPTRYYTGVTETDLHPVSGPPQTLFNLIFPYTPGGAAPPTYNLAPITPRVNVIGGNAYGGNLLPGTYYLEYTFVGPGGVESALSPASATFVVAPGNIPQVSLPTLPPGATGYNIYLSDPVANPGSATLYAAGVTTTTYSLQRNALSGKVVPPAINFPTAAPTIAPKGGGATGGLLAPGTYILSYTFVNAAGAETNASPYSTPFTVTAGQIPQVTLPPLPGGVSPGATTAYNIYLSGPSADPTSVIRYAAGVTTTTFNLAAAALTGDTVRPPQPTPATVTPLVQALGGGPTGGQLAPGTYFVYYTYTYSNGTETAASPNSAYFTVVSGYIPLVTLPPLPVDATGYNIYLSDSSADPGSATRYASGITTTTWTLASAVPPAGVSPPSTSSATVAPTVKASGGGATGGRLAAGTYFALYTFVYPNNTESFPSPSSAAFVVTAGQIPQMTLPPLPTGASGYNVYLSNASAAAGSALSYATEITTPLFNLANAAPTGGIAPPTTQIPTIAPTVKPTGGSPFGGRLMAGSYFVFYTFTYSNGVESLPSAASAPFTVAAGNVPMVTLPTLPVGATGINLYLSDATGASGPAVRYATGIKTTTFLLPYDAPVNGTDRPVNPIATVAPTVSATGGGTVGGKLAPGTYYLFYTFNYQGSAYPVGVESAPSPSSLPFTVVAGNIPQVSLPLLPVGVLPVNALSYNIYLSDSSADPNTATRYATGFTGTTFNLAMAVTSGTAQAPITNISTIVPTVAATGGGATGGKLAPGTYYVLYTFAYPNGTETLPSPSSATFNVSAGNIPQVTLPPLPAGSIGFNIYLSNARGTAGSAVRYASDITSSIYQLQSASPVGGVSRSLNPAATVAPTVLATGGGTTGGNLAPGKYSVVYTYIYASGAESFGSPSSLPFTVSAGNVPEVMLPSLPNGATGYDIYLSDSSADAGSAARYASTVTTPNFLLLNAAPDGGLSLPPTNVASGVPTVNPIGGGTTGGQLLPGTYDLVYTFKYPNGAESFSSPISAKFTVAAGQVPQVMLPVLPIGATSFNIYLSDDAANAGSLTLYASGVTAITFNLQRNALSQDVFTPVSGSAPTVPMSEVLPTVSATGGGTTGGHLAPGTYFVFYSLVSTQGYETYLSTSSNTFTVVAGNIPQLSLPPVPDGFSGFDVYLSNSSAVPGSGTIYAVGVATTTLNLSRPAHAGGAVSLLVGDNLTIPSPTLALARQSVTARGDHGNADPSLGTTINVDAAVVSPDVLLTGENDNDTFNVQATAAGSFVTVFTGAGANTINLGSKQPQPYAGIADNLQGAELILGSGNDTANVDDTGSVGPKTGFLTAFPTPAGQVAPAGALTGLNMGAAGIAYSGLSNFNITLGAGGINQPTSPVIGNTFDIDVPGGLNLPADTTVFGGPSNNDSVTGVWGSNFNTVLNLYQFEHGTVSVGNNFTGTMNDLLPGNLEQVTVGTTMTPGSVLNAGTIGTMTIGPNHLVVGDNLAGYVNVLGSLGSLTVAGGTPGSIAAGTIGTIADFGGYGPIVAQIKEDGIQRQINATSPNYPYATPNPAALPIPSTRSYVNFEYYYEGLATGLGNPQLTARVTNGVGTSADQFDFALITDNDVAKFNLARLDAVGVAGVRNVEVEGDLLTTITAGAQQFFGLANNQGGVRLPFDNLAGVEIRDYAPPNSIQAKSIQGVAFGSTTRFTINHVIYGSTEVASDAANLLVLGTAIVQANDTFLVPFADVMNQQVGFFIDDTPNTNMNQFDNADVVFTDQFDNAEQQNVDRGAVTALVSVTKAAYVYAAPSGPAAVQPAPVGPMPPVIAPAVLSPSSTMSGGPKPLSSLPGGIAPPPSPPGLSSIIQTIDLRGDGGSIISKQWVAQGITSTGPMGDVAINVALGMTNVTAPSFFGNITSYGPITGTVQSTGVRVDPIFGTTSTTSADIGRAYVTLLPGGSPSVTVTGIQTDINGRPAFPPMGLVGRIISRGNLISQLKAAGGIYGSVAVQGDIGSFATILSRTNPTRVGGIATDTTDSGQIVAMGQIIGDVSLLGGLLGTGLIAARGSILGNLAINGQIATTAKIISGGTIGSAALSTGLSFGVNQGIVGAIGTTIQKSADPTVAPGFYVSNAGSVPPPMNFNAQAIDAIFEAANGGFLNGFDLLANGDLTGLADILADLARLRVVNGRLADNPT